MHSFQSCMQDLSRQTVPERYHCDATGHLKLDLGITAVHMLFTTTGSLPVDHHRRWYRGDHGGGMCAHAMQCTPARPDLQLYSCTKSLQLCILRMCAFLSWQQKGTHKIH